MELCYEMYCSGNALLWHGKIWLRAVLALTSIISLFRLNTKVFVIPVLKSKGKVWLGLAK